MRKLIVPAAVAMTLATASFASAAMQHHYATGMVKSYNAKTMMLTLTNGSKYEVPKMHRGLKAGEKVKITYDMHGKMRQAEAIKMMM